MDFSKEGRIIADFGEEAGLNGLLKILIAAACVAVIAFVGQSFWRDHQESVAAADRTQMALCLAARDKLLAEGAILTPSQLSPLQAIVRNCLQEGRLLAIDVRGIDLNS